MDFYPFRHRPSRILPSRLIQIARSIPRNVPSRLKNLLFPRKSRFQPIETHFFREKSNFPAGKCLPAADEWLSRLGKRLFQFEKALFDAKELLRVGKGRFFRERRRSPARSECSSPRISPETAIGHEIAHRFRRIRTLFPVLWAACPPATALAPSDRFGRAWHTPRWGRGKPPFAPSLLPTGLGIASNEPSPSWNRHVSPSSEPPWVSALPSCCPAPSSLGNFPCRPTCRRRSAEDPRTPWCVGARTHGSCETGVGAF